MTYLTKKLQVRLPDLKIRKCSDCPALIKGIKGGGRCKPCQYDFQVNYQRERSRKVKVNIFE